MISLIICSRKEGLPDDLKNNIQTTIGVDYEIIFIDNSASRHSIFSAYQSGVEKSKYEYLCFMHDDIVYHSTDWGKKVIDHFTDAQTGLIGIAGADYLSFFPGSLWSSGLLKSHVLYDEHDIARLNKRIHSGVPSQKNEVIAVDGVWFCTRKKVFEKVCFDKKTFKGFHYYDIDLCLQIHHAGYKMFCVPDIHIMHQSLGEQNKQWIANALVFHKKWRRVLPLSVVPMTYKTKCTLDWIVLNQYIRVLKHNHYPEKRAYRTALSLLMQHYKCFFFYKTPFYFAKLLSKSI